MTDFAVISEQISREVAKDGWGQIPRLGIVIEDRPVDGVDVAVIVGLPLPDAAWDGNHPITVIRGVTEMVEHSPMPAPPLEPGQTMVGVLLIVEAWQGIIPDDATDEERAQFEKWCETQSIGDHPWGHDARNTWIVGFDGSFTHTDYLRDSRTHTTWTDSTAGSPATAELFAALAGLAMAMREVAA